MKLNPDKFRQLLLFSLFHICILPFVLGGLTSIICSNPTHRMSVFIILTFISPFVLASVFSFEKKSRHEKPKLKILSR